ncbi:N-alpha-acetyltransferase 16, NatA auxiliary subunit [Arachis hypogaea]|nr:N-alpha-acetyltransferase 16, NatA auxiliary subunit [Arachis hypogaea]
MGTPLRHSTLGSWAPYLNMDAGHWVPITPSPSECATSVGAPYVRAPSVSPVNFCPSFGGDSLCTRRVAISLSEAVAPPSPSPSLVAPPSTTFSIRSAVRIPPDFLQGDKFRAPADNYIRPLLTKGEKRNPFNSYVDFVFVGSGFLPVQQYDIQGQYEVALSKIDEAIEHIPTVIDLYSVKAIALTVVSTGVAVATMTDLQLHFLLHVWHWRGLYQML